MGDGVGKCFCCFIEDGDEKSECFRRATAPVAEDLRTGKKQRLIVDPDQQSLADLHIVAQCKCKPIPKSASAPPKSAAKIGAAVLAEAKKAIRNDREQGDGKCLSRKGTAVQQLLLSASRTVHSNAGRKILVAGAGLSKRQRTELSKSGNVVAEYKPAGRPAGTTRWSLEDVRKMLEKHCLESSRWSIKADAPYLNLKSSILQLWGGDDEIGRAYAYSTICQKLRYGRVGIGHTSQITDVCPACAVWDNYLQPKIEAGIRKVEQQLEGVCPTFFDGFKETELKNDWCVGSRVTQPEWADAWFRALDKLG